MKDSQYCSPSVHDHPYISSSAMLVGTIIMCPTPRKPGDEACSNLCVASPGTKAKQKG